MKCLLKYWLTLVIALLAGARVQAAGESFTIAVIPKGTIHEFWKSIHAGAEKAKLELASQGIKVDLIWKGPLREDDRDQQIQVVENFISRRVDGIVLAPLDERALVGPVEMAARAKIPVVIIDSPLKSDIPVSYVATDNFKGGQLAAKFLGDLLAGKGKVMMLRYQAGSASNDLRDAGFLDVITKQYQGIELISTNQYAGVTRDSAYQAAQNPLNRYGRGVNGVFCCNAPVTVGMLLALRDAQKAGGAIKLVGFDANPQMIDALKKGDIQALVVQDPVRMGCLGVLTLARHLQGQKVDKVIDTGLRLVTTRNIDKPEIQQLLHPPLDKFLN